MLECEVFGSKAFILAARQICKRNMGKVLTRQSAVRGFFTAHLRRQRNNFQRAQPIIITLPYFAFRIIFFFNHFCQTTLGAGRNRWWACQALLSMFLWETNMRAILQNHFDWTMPLLASISMSLFLQHAIRIQYGNTHAQSAVWNIFFWWEWMPQRFKFA